MKDKANCALLVRERLKLVAQLWDANIAAETSYKDNAKTLKQFQEAEEADIPVVIVLGPSELEEGVVKVCIN